MSAVPSNFFSGDTKNSGLEKTFVDDFGTDLVISDSNEFKIKFKSGSNHGFIIVVPVGTDGVGVKVAQN